MYNKNYLGKEKELAQLLGFQNIMEMSGNLYFCTSKANGNNLKKFLLPKWCLGNNHEAFKLQLKYRLCVNVMKTEVEVTYDDDEVIVERYCHHNDNEEIAVRYAIVCAVIKKLKK